MMTTKSLSVALMLLLLTAGSASSQEALWNDAPWPPEEGARDKSGETPVRAAGAPRLYGTISTAAQATLPDAGIGGIAELPAHAGTLTAVRIKGDWQPSELVEIYVEGCVSHATGTLNPLSWSQNLGLDGGQLALLQAGAPGGEYRTTFELTQAWAQLRFRSADLQLGRLPIAWGTGYAFNPTMRTHPSQSLSSGLGEGTMEVSTPGTAGVVAAVPFGSAANLEGYLAFEDRTHTSLSLAHDADPNNLPWGARVRIALGAVDASFGALKEVLSPGAAAVAGAVQASAPVPRPQRRFYATSDLAGTLGELGFYAEAALQLPVWDGTRPADWHFSRAVESTVGVDYTLPGEVNLKIEYYHNGAGQPDRALYDPTLLLNGAAPLLGSDYLFVYLGRTFFDYLDTTVAALGNLRDTSVIVAPALTYSFSDEFTMFLIGIVPVGGNGSEFGGPLALPGGASFRLLRPSLLLEAQVTF